MRSPNTVIILTGKNNPRLSGLNKPCPQPQPMGQSQVTAQLPENRGHILRPRRITQLDPVVLRSGMFEDVFWRCQAKRQGKIPWKHCLQARWEPRTFLTKLIKSNKTVKWLLIKPNNKINTIWKTYIFNSRVSKQLLCILLKELFEVIEPLTKILLYRRWTGWFCY